ncbi:hypothetical protein SAMN05421755_105212 [Nitrosomonas sp. Nm33]|nr:hypothetical protein SAMN05421755_105212 [Nitrosomonas sp. Nm33]
MQTSIIQHLQFKTVSDPYCCYCCVTPIALVTRHLLISPISFTFAVNLLHKPMTCSFTESESAQEIALITFMMFLSDSSQADRQTSDIT